MGLPFVLLLLVGTATSSIKFDAPLDYNLFFWQGINSLQYHLDIRIPRDSRRFTIEFCTNVLCTMDKVLHFRARFDKQHVARSHRLNGKWSSELTSGVMPFERGGEFSMKIITGQSRFEIYIDDVLFCQYNGVFHREAQYVMKISGKVEITHWTEFVDKSMLSPAVTYWGFKRSPIAGDRLQIDILLAANWKSLGKFHLDLNKMKDRLRANQIICEFSWPSSTFTLKCMDENPCTPAVTTVTLKASQWFTISINFSLNSMVKFYYKQIYLGEIRSNYATVRSIHFQWRIDDYKMRFIPASAPQGPPRRQ
ncbi:uncharacterized protein LOC131958506 [Physella acuta]|uniref:uncharacterized protein LOC131958506 n=1 Tax=Physella acuta TaxID=109671 RepID=UPI0027DDF147|nr:uncharacterized protein LOC131958506 [Physella acuta]